MGRIESFRELTFCRSVVIFYPKMSFLGEEHITNKEINSMEDILTIHIPDEIRHKLNRTPEEMCRDIRTYAALMLFSLGKLSSGAAALMAGIPRISNFGIVKTGWLIDSSDHNTSRQVLLPAHAASRDHAPLTVKAMYVSKPQHVGGYLSQSATQFKLLEKFFKRCLLGISANGVCNRKGGSMKLAGKIGVFLLVVFISNGYAFDVVHNKTDALLSIDCTNPQVELSVFKEKNYLELKISLAGKNIVVYKGL